MEDGLFPIISDENQSIPYLSMKPIKLLLLCIRKNVDASTQEGDYCRCLLSGDGYDKHLG